MLLPDSGGSGRLLYKLSLTEQISLNNCELDAYDQTAAQCRLEAVMLDAPKLQ